MTLSKAQTQTIDGRARTVRELLDKAKYSMKPLSLTEYNKLAWHLRETGQQPQDLFDPGALRVVNESWPKLDIERVHRLLGRGFILAQAVERWRARSIWVVTRADEDFPRQRKKRMREKTPPVLYGCGNRDLMDGGGLENPPSVKFQLKFQSVKLVDNSSFLIPH